MRVICSWCGVEIYKKEGDDSNVISHGACPKCFVEQALSLENNPADIEARKNLWQETKAAFSGPDLKPSEKSTAMKLYEQQYRDFLKSINELDELKTLVK